MLAARCRLRSPPTSGPLGRAPRGPAPVVVRNGHHAEREVMTAAGALAVRAPRVNDKRVDESLPVSGNGSPRPFCRILGHLPLSRAEAGAAMS